MDHEPSEREQCIDAARTALAAFPHADLPDAGEEPDTEDYTNNAVNLITDTLLLAEAEGCDVDTVLSKVMAHYTAECAAREGRS